MSEEQKYWPNRMTKLNLSPEVEKKIQATIEKTFQTISPGTTYEFKSRDSIISDFKNHIHNILEAQIRHDARLAIPDTFASSKINHILAQIQDDEPDPLVF